MENFVRVEMKMVDGNLIPKNKGNEYILDEFKKNLKDRQTVYILMEAGNPSASKSQKNIFNLNARKVAESQGCTVKEIKQIIKDRCGLGYKSSEDCSMEELSLLIEETKVVCNAADVPFIGL